MSGDYAIKLPIAHSKIGVVAPLANEETTVDLLFNSNCQHINGCSPIEFTGILEAYHDYDKTNS